MRPIRSPSECDGLAIGERFEVGGRVLYVDQQTIVLADAFSRVALQSNETPSDIAPGDLVLIDAEFGAERSQALSIERIASCPEPTGATEFGRRALTHRGRHLRARALAKRAIRTYLDARGFVEVDTPSVVPSPGLDAHVSSWGGTEIGQRTLFLITSPEFHMKRLLSSGLPKIYQICHCFRAEELGPWHEPEFMMLEWYRSFADWETTMHDTEEILRTVAVAISDERTQLDLEAPFERITVSDAFSTFGGVKNALDLAETDEASFFDVLVNQVEPALACFPRPVFLTHYPISQAALARPSPQHPGTAERYELYFRGQELCNGFSELTDSATQRKRFEAELDRRTQSSEPVYPIDERFLAALDEGLPPCSGNAVGLDRLVTTLLGLQRLESVFSFTNEES